MCHINNRLSKCQFQDSSCQVHEFPNLVTSMRTTLNYVQQMFIVHSGSNHRVFYLYRPTSARLSLTHFQCTCASQKGQNSYTVISVPCRIGVSADGFNYPQQQGQIAFLTTSGMLREILEFSHFEFSFNFQLLHHVIQHGNKYEDS